MPCNKLKLQLYIHLIIFYSIVLAGINIFAWFFLGQSGSIVYDFFIGRELNPRVGPVDLKFFCELRPGLIGWVMLDFVFVAEAWKTMEGSSLSALLLVVAFHVLYVADALWHEV